MASSKLPAMQWYPGDWRKDPGVQSLDYYDRGVWRELIDVMHESAERGRLVFPTGAPMEDTDIARLLGIEEAKWKQIRSRLISRGVASEDAAGVLYNRRMVRDEDLRQARAEAGRKGGQKSRPSKPEANEEANGKQKGGSSVSSSTSMKKEKTPMGSKRKKTTRLPEDWSPNETHQQIASEEGVDLDREAENFRDHATANDRRMVDWDAAFRTWLRKARDYGAANGKHSTPQRKDPLTRTPAELDAMGL